MLEVVYVNPRRVLPDDNQRQTSKGVTIGKKKAGWYGADDIFMVTEEQSVGHESHVVMVTLGTRWQGTKPCR